MPGLTVEVLSNSQLYHYTGLTSSQMPGVCPGGGGRDGRFWNWLIHKPSHLLYIRQKPLQYNFLLVVRRSQWGESFDDWRFRILFQLTANILDHLTVDGLFWMAQLTVHGNFVSAHFRRLATMLLAVWRYKPWIRFWKSTARHVDLFAFRAPLSQPRSFHFLLPTGSPRCDILWWLILSWRPTCSNDRSNDAQCQMSRP